MTAPNPGHPLNRLGVWVWVCVALIAFGAFQGGPLLDDPFHHGEYFASAMGILSPLSQGQFPLTIHGALDFLPALLTHSIWGADRFFGPTFALYKLLNFLAAALLWVLALLQIRDRPELEKERKWLLPALALLAPTLVGYRDLFLLGTWVYFTLIQRRSKVGVRAESGLYFGLGVMVCFSMHWSFDRGIATASSIAVGVLVSCLSSRRVTQALTSLAGWGLTVAALSWASPLFSIENYWANFRVLMETSGQWRYGWTDVPIQLTLISVALNGIVILSALSSRHFASLALSALTLVMLKIGANRADLEHILWSLWAPLLLALQIQFDESRSRRWIRASVVACAFVGLATIIWSIERRDPRLALAAVMIGAALFGQTSSSYVKPWARKSAVAVFTALTLWLGTQVIKTGGRSKYPWLTYLAKPPLNRELAKPGVVWAAEQLARAQVTCVFDLSNTGIINGLTGLPSCSRFTYPVYATREYEHELIEAVQTTKPSAIVYWSNTWYYSIDNKPMNQRFPELDAYLKSAYSKAECSLGHCVAFIR